MQNICQGTIKQIYRGRIKERIWRVNIFTYIQPNSSIGVLMLNYSAYIIEAKLCTRSSGSKMGIVTI